MTMDDDQIDEQLPLGERKAIMETVPWVAHIPHGVDAGLCEVLTTDAPLKAYWTPEWTQRDALDPVNAKYRCKNRAHWVFISADGRIRKMCWSHLWYAGFYGTMQEEERFEKWANQREEKV